MTIYKCLQEELERTYEQEHGPSEASTRPGTDQGIRPNSSTSKGVLNNSKVAKSGSPWAPTTTSPANSKCEASSASENHRDEVGLQKRPATTSATTGWSSVFSNVPSPPARCDDETMRGGSIE